MRQLLRVNNVKCGGCEASIIDKLEKLEGISNVNVNSTTGEVEFDAVDDTSLGNVRLMLIRMGYPEDDPTMLQTAKSYVNCMIGRTKT